MLSRNAKILCALVAGALSVGTPALSQTPQVPVEQTNKQLKCLTDNVYYEAGNQTYQGKLAVANVVINRVKDKRFPNTPCGVIYQRNQRVCQFSWVCKDHRVRNATQYQQSREVAKQVLEGRVADNTFGSLFFHAKYVNPKWKYTRVTVVDSHIFYKG